jgi:Ser/Thr protein kinase RdoA (MazF antagonist)
MKHVVAPAQLPADLAILVRNTGVALIQVIPVTTLPSMHLDRACFRLMFADGRVLKGRCVQTIDQADRLEALTRRLDRRHFPALLARHRRAFLTDWIDGRPLDRGRSTTAVLRQCGAVHAAVHRIPVDARPEWQRRHGPWQARIESCLRILVDAAVIETAEARRAETLASESEPHRVELGLCHGDLCAENIVVDPTGRVVVIDNDSLAVDAYGYDFARTWYRWPMTDAERRHYMTGYGPAHRLAEVEAHFIHWAIIALVEAAAFRVRVRVRGAEVALRRLRAVLRDPDRRARFPGLVRNGACTS